MTVSADRTTCGSVRRRYATSSAIETMLSPCSGRELDQLGAAGHRSGVLAGDDLAQRPRRTPAREAGQIDRRLRGSRPSEHPAVAGPHRDHVTGPPEVGRVRRRRGERRDGPGAVGRRDSGAAPHQSTATRSAAL